MHTTELQSRFPRRARPRRDKRRGAAVVECALTAPLLALFALGAIEVGQFINVSQSVCNASRVGARIAARLDTATTTTVTSDVEAYLSANGIPTNSVTVTLTDNAGATVSGAALASVASGESISVQVEVEFALVRSLSFLSWLDGAANTSTTTMRRE
jgi:Flp pilus assembly protein TadG